MAHKIVINGSFGGFGLSHEAKRRLFEMGSKYIVKDEEGRDAYYGEYDMPRHDPMLVQIVEEMGEKADGDFAKLGVVEINSHQYFIEEYDGQESVRTPETQVPWVTIET